MKQTTDGECEERSYTNGVLDGEATVIFPDGSKEIRTYKDNKLNGPAMIFAANGDRIELSYENGVVNGKATIKGVFESTIFLNLNMIITMIESEQIKCVCFIF